MNRAVAIIGGISTVLLVALAALIGFVAVSGRKLDRESRQYADNAIRAISSSWDQKELLDRASPELLTWVHSHGGVEPLFAEWRRLGPMLAFDGSKGQARVSVLFGMGTSVTADYFGSATFLNGSARIAVSLIKHDRRWQILRFSVYFDPARAPSTRSMMFRAPASAAPQDARAASS